MRPFGRAEPRQGPGYASRNPALNGARLAFVVTVLRFLRSAKALAALSCASTAHTPLPRRAPCPGDTCWGTTLRAGCWSSRQAANVATRASALAGAGLSPNNAAAPAKAHAIRRQDSVLGMKSLLHFSGSLWPATGSRNPVGVLSERGP